MNEVKEETIGEGGNQEEEIIDDNFDLDFNKHKKKKKSKKKDLDEIMAEVDDKAEDKENGKYHCILFKVSINDQMIIFIKYIQVSVKLEGI